MPNPVTPSPTDTTWLADAPAGADTPFEELFGNDPEKSLSSGTPETQTTTTSAVSSQAPDATTTRPPETTDEWLPIKARTGTVYNSREDTVKGIEEKDTLIAQLRAQLKEVTGTDPVSKSPARPDPSQPTSYLGNPTKYAEDLASAAKAGDANRYMQIQIALQDERNRQTFAAYEPLLQELSRTRAQKKVAESVKEFDQFIGSDNYQKVLEHSPALRNAISTAEQNVAYSQQLDELYRLAYDSHIARNRVPELIQAATQTPSTPSTPAAAVRPVVSTTTLSPAAATTAASDAELMRSAQGRKELMDRFRAQGFDNIRF